MKKMNFIDLFAGCGGLSEGFYRQGFNALAHVEINHAACETLKTRMKHYGYDNVEKSVLELDITRDDVIEKLMLQCRDRRLMLLLVVRLVRHILVLEGLRMKMLCKMIREIICLKVMSRF